ncbi:mitochondrial nicotinamide adenine dinucleotide transporter 1 [Diutina catenulata]
MAPPHPVDPPDRPEDHSDFTDMIAGGELPITTSEKPTFDIDQRHKIESLRRLGPDSVLRKCSASQIVSLAGAMSGFLSGVIVCPFDVIKTRMQAAGFTPKPGAQGHGRPLNVNFINIARKIWREEGIRGFYRGLVPITIGYLPTWTIYFSVYERMKNRYPKWLAHHFGITQPAVSHVLSAVTAGMASSIAVNPIWVVKTRLMIQTGNGHSIPTKSAAHQAKRTYYRGTLDAFRTMYKEEGLPVFYSGLLPSLFGLVHVGIHFPVYEKLKQVFRCDIPVHDDGYLVRLIGASAISKMIASSITYPHEIVRTRMQIQAGDHHKVGMVETIKSVFRQDGFRGFYSGYIINLVRTVPASAVTLVSFEYFKTYLLEISGKLVA